MLVKEYKALIRRNKFRDLLCSLVAMVNYSVFLKIVQKVDLKCCHHKNDK
jgi:ABC-type uncharacterized transport system permease subunit